MNNKKQHIIATITDLGNSINGKIGGLLVKTPSSTTATTDLGYRRTKTIISNNII